MFAQLLSCLGKFEVSYAVDTHCRGREIQDEIIPSVTSSPLLQFTCVILSQYLFPYPQLVLVMHFTIRLQSRLVPMIFVCLGEVFGFMWILY